MEIVPLKKVLMEKPLYYKEIDPTRMEKTYQLIKEELTLPPLIRIVGTNGKGTTGRFLALLFRQKGLKVGHYTSPHLFQFNERFWLDGRIATNHQLERANRQLQTLLPETVWKRLSYFEYATFLAVILFQSMDVGIMESGLGGELDATAVFDYRATLFTPIHLDHQAFLGERIEQIIETKLKGSKGIKIFGRQPFQKKVIEVLNRFQLSQLEGNWDNWLDYTTLFSKEEIYQLQRKFPYPDFLFSNYLLALAYFRWKFQTLPKSVPKLDLPGRCQQILPNIWLDVGHNPLSAMTISHFFRQKGQKVDLIYLTYRDKNYRLIGQILKPIVRRVTVLELPENPRVASAEQVALTFSRLGMEAISPAQITPPLLLYGSFLVGEGILKNRIHFSHLPALIERLKEMGGE